MYTVTLGFQEKMKCIQNRIILFYNIFSSKCKIFEKNALKVAKEFVHFYLLQNAQVLNVKSSHRLFIGTNYQNNSVFDLNFPG